MGFPGVIRCCSCVLVLVWMLGGESSAHQDPLGDVHPSVRVEKGNFAIYFASNRDPDERRKAATMRMVFSPAGQLLAPRHRVGEMPDDTPKARLRGWDFAVQAGDDVLMFAPYDRLFHGKPYYSQEVDGRVRRYRLPWPNEVRISGLHAVVADERSILVAAKAGTPVLSFYHFSRERFELPGVVEIGSPTSIYDFPTASNIVQARGKYWIAWMRANKEKGKIEAVLSNWKPGDERTAEVVLDSPGNWNSSLSMQASGDVLCLAYHCSIDGVYPGRSEIVTVFRPLE